MSAELLPAMIDGPLPEVQAMLQQMQAGETVLCDVEGTLTIAAGNLLLGSVHYKQVNVSVRVRAPDKWPGFGFLTHPASLVRQSWLRARGTLC